MSWVAVAIGGAAVVGAVVSSNSADKAKDAQDEATKAGTATAHDSLALNKQQYEEGVARQKPFLDAGVGALGKLNTLLGLGPDSSAQGYGSLNQPFTGADLASDPGYQFQLQQGQKQLDRRQAASGGFFSGAGLQEAEKFGQGLASTSFNDAFNRNQTNRSNILNPLQSMAGQGQTQANQVNALGAQFAGAQTGVNNSLIGLATNMGNANGAAAIAQGNALTGGINNGLTAWQRAQYMNQPQQQYNGFNSSPGGYTYAEPWAVGPT
jgi:hypothetical protein